MQSALGAPMSRVQRSGSQLAAHLAAKRQCSVRWNRSRQFISLHVVAVALKRHRDPQLTLLWLEDALCCGAVDAEWQLDLASKDDTAVMDIQFRLASRRYGLPA